MRDGFPCLKALQSPKRHNVRICIIFNPTARGEKAKRFQRHLSDVAGQCTLKPTTGPGTAQTLAQEAVREKFDAIVAAGGDGTVNEVLNGIAKAPDEPASVRLGVLPLGTINVFAKEIGLPDGFTKNWEIILRGQELVIDLPYADFINDGRKERRYFAQLAGAGLDSRAIELVDWNLKKASGALAYVSAGFRALRKKLHPVTVTVGDRVEAGELVLVGNGRFYGGKLKFFPKADLRDGKLDVCIFPRVDWEAAARCGWGLLTDQMLKHSGAIHLDAEQFTLSCDVPTQLELDGDNIGSLPATFGVLRERLRVIVP